MRFRYAYSLKAKMNSPKIFFRKGTMNSCVVNRFIICSGRHISPHICTCAMLHCSSSHSPLSVGVWLPPQDCLPALSPCDVPYDPLLPESQSLSPSVKNIPIGANS